MAQTGYLYERIQVRIVLFMLYVVHTTCLLKFLPSTYDSSAFISIIYLFIYLIR